MLITNLVSFMTLEQKKTKERAKEGVMKPLFVPALEDHFEGICNLVEKALGGSRRSAMERLQTCKNQTQRFVALCGHDVVATAGYIMYERHDGMLLGWIGFVACDELFRRKGFAEHLTKLCLRDLAARGCIHVSLESSENALSLYKKLGFVMVGRTEIFRLTCPSVLYPTNLISSGGTVEILRQSSLPLVAKYDECKFGADRLFLLEVLLGQEGNTGFLLRKESIVGYVVYQYEADVIGPFVVNDDEGLKCLLCFLLKSLSGKYRTPSLYVPTGSESHHLFLMDLGFSKAGKTSSMQRCARNTHFLERSVVSETSLGEG